MALEATQSSFYAKEAQPMPSIFSIVTPTFNQLDWLRLCIASVRDQAVATPSLLRSRPSTLSIEHIVQDAGTPRIEDLAREVGAEFYRDGQLVYSEQKEKRQPHLQRANEDQAAYSIKVFSEKDAGMYDAINRGFARSTGEICAWLNSDEQYLPETLSKVAEIFQRRTKLDVLLGDAILLNSSFDAVCYRRIMVPNLWHTRLDHLHSLTCAMFFKKSALPNPPLNPRWKVVSDAILMEHFLLSKKNIHTCRLPLATYAFTGQNLSADKNCKELEQWWAETRWPPRSLKTFIVIQNRFRRLLAGAYQNFQLNTKIHTFTGFKSLRRRVSGLWPR
jgi:glycosyltransferase involved in cell wall biosynthesis